MADLAAQLAGDLPAWQVLLILAAAFAASVFHTLSGFAGGVLLSFLIAPLLGVEAVVPVLAVALTISATSRVWAFRCDIDLAVLANIMLPALPCIAFGALIYSRLSADVISIILGLFLVLIVALRRPLAARGQRIGTVGLGVVGAVFGVLSGLTIGAGLMLAPFILGRGLLRERMAAIFACIGFLLNLTKSAVFVTTMTLDSHLLLLGAVIGLCSLPGTYLGYSILRRTPVRIHTAFVETLVAVGGVIFVWHGVSELSEH